MKKLLLIGMCVYLVGCASPLSKNQDKVTLENTKWNLKLIAGKKTIQKSIVTLRFKEQKIAGRSGCNSYFGKYAVGAGFLELTKIGVTRRACDGKGLMAQESEYLSFLKEVTTWNVSEKKLILKTSEGKKLVFIRASDN